MRRKRGDPEVDALAGRRHGGAGRYGERERAHGLHVAAILVTWGLRDYGLPAGVWGGEAECDHVWGGEIRLHQGGPHGEGRLGGGSRVVVEAQAKVKSIRAGAFCARCGAWRGCLGLEPAPELYLEHLVEVFRQVRRVLRADGTLWLNLGDCYASGGRGGGGSFMSGRRDGSWRQRGAAKGWRAAPAGLKDKDLVGMPWRLAFALQADGWWLRRDVIWAKPNPMPESVTDRPTASHEYVFLLSRSRRYFYDAEAVREADLGGDHPRRVLGMPEPSGGLLQPHRGIRTAGGRNGAGRNLRSVWSIPTAPFAGAHFATFPPELAERCIRAGSSEQGCCAECGAPWKRQVAVRYDNPGRRRGNGPRSVARKGIERGTAGFARRLERRAVTTGWRPSCACGGMAMAEAAGVGRESPESGGRRGATGVRPCTVLDPFSGAGTTALVALRLGRTAVGIELNPEYVEMAARRIRDDAPLLNGVVVRTWQGEGEVRVRQEEEGEEEGEEGEEG
jgi:DNA modification methylase